MEIRDNLSHSFSRHTGTPLSRYISAVRTGHAMYLLREEKPAITEIAYEVGLQSLSQFNRTFRALRGMAPGEFRRQERDDAGKISNPAPGCFNLPALAEALVKQTWGDRPEWL